MPDKWHAQLWKATFTTNPDWWLLLYAFWDQELQLAFFLATDSHSVGNCNNLRPHLTVIPFKVLHADDAYSHTVVVLWQTGGCCQGTICYSQKVFAEYCLALQPWQNNMQDCRYIDSCDRLESTSQQLVYKNTSPGVPLWNTWQLDQGGKVLVL
jgi:hypothetical protein